MVGTQAKYHIRCGQGILAVERGGQLLIAGFNCDGSRHVQRSGRLYAMRVSHSKNYSPLSLLAQSGAQAGRAEQ